MVEGVQQGPVLVGTFFIIGHLACLCYGPVSWRKPVTRSCIRGVSDREPV